MNPCINLIVPSSVAREYKPMVRCSWIQTNGTSVFQHRALHRQLLAAIKNSNFSGSFQGINLLVSSFDLAMIQAFTIYIQVTSFYKGVTWESTE